MVDLAARLFDHILDAGRMDAAVGDELFKRQPRNLAAHGVKRRNGDRLGRVVDDEVDTRDRLEGADVAALAADDAALHLIVRQRHNGNGGLGHMVRRAALDGGGDDLPRQRIGVVLELLLDLLDLDGGFVPHVVFYALEDVGFRFLLRQARDLIQHLHLAALEACDLFLLRLDVGGLFGKLVFLLFMKVKLLVERFFLLLEPPLLLLKLASALFYFLFVLVPRFMDFFLCFEQHLALLAFAALDRLVDDAASLFFGASDFLLRDLLAIGHADEETDRANHDQCDAKDEA